MIVPTVGRVVLYFPGRLMINAGVIAAMTGKELSAQIAFVHNDGRINIGYLDMYGKAANAEHVRLLQDDDAVPDDGGPYCT